MPPHNTRSAASKRAFAPHDNVTVSPSRSVSLEPEVPLDQPVTPDEDEDERSWRSPSADLIETADEQDSLEVENHLCSLDERASTECILAQLQEQKRVIEALAARMEDVTRGQPKPDQQVNRNRVGPNLPVGVVGLGREGTWVVEDPWQPIFTPSTNQLPTVREFGEEQGLKDLPLNNVTQEDRIPSNNPHPRGLTPLPSFVSGNPT